MIGLLAAYTLGLATMGVPFVVAFVPVYRAASEYWEQRKALLDAQRIADGGAR